MATQQQSMSVDLAAKQFALAVEAFVDDRLDWIANSARKSPGLYSRMRTALTQRGYRLSSAAAQSRPPCALPILDWLTDVDDGIRQWHAGGTVYALRSLAATVWTPDDVDALQARTAALTAWTRSAMDLLGEAPPKVPVRKPCPVCNELWVRSGIEQIRSYALIVDEDGAHCGSCRSTWGPDQLPLLARMIDA